MLLFGIPNGWVFGTRRYGVGHQLTPRQKLTEPLRNFSFWLAMHVSSLCEWKDANVCGLERPRRSHCRRFAVREQVLPSEQSW